MSLQSILRVNILGVGISATNLKEATRVLIGHALTRAGGYVNICTVHSIVEAQDDPALKTIFNRSLMATPDGMPLSWIGWSQGFRTMDRTYGPDLMLEILRNTEGTGLSHFFYGGKEGVASELARLMRERFSGVSIAGEGTPPFRPLTQGEREELVGRLNELKPAFVWIGISTPKQDKLMAELSPLLPGVILIGVGAAFDFHTGRVPQAPRWIQRAGCEWLFRLIQEPNRLWRRYVLSNPRFVWQLFLQWTGWKRFSAPL